MFDMFVKMFAEFSDSAPECKLVLQHLVPQHQILHYPAACFTAPNLEAAHFVQLITAMLTSS